MVMTMAQETSLWDILPKPDPGRSTLVLEQNDGPRRAMAAALAKSWAEPDLDAMVVVDLYGGLAKSLPRGEGWLSLDLTGQSDGFSGLGLLDPYYFRDREACVSTLLRVGERMWPGWHDMGGMLRQGWETLYECNRRGGVEFALLDVIRLLGSGDEGVRLRKYAAGRVGDKRLSRWLDKWDDEAAAGAVAALETHLGSDRLEPRGAAALGLAEGTIDLGVFLGTEGIAVAASGSAATVGLTAAAFLCSAVAVQAAAAMPAGGVLLLEGVEGMAGVDWPEFLEQCRQTGVRAILSGNGCDPDLLDAVDGLVVGQPPAGIDGDALGGALGLPAVGDLDGLPEGCGYARFRDDDGVVVLAGPVPLLPAWSRRKVSAEPAKGPWRAAKRKKRKSKRRKR